MRRIQEIEIELPQIVLERADAAYAQIRQQAAQESPAGRRVRSFPRAAGILLAVVILSATAVSAAAVGIMGYRRYLAERMTDIGTEELGHLEMVAGQGSVQAEFNRGLTAREQSVYEQLTREYEEDGKYPAGQLHELAEEENYSGTGVAVRSTPGEEYGCLIYLPSTTVTEEEWLEVIEYVHKLDYSIQEKIWQQKYSEVSYFDRYEQMSDAEIDELYAMLSSAPVDVWGGDSRDLTPEEQTRYEEWTEKYEQENAYTETTITVITFPEEYDGQELVYCIADAQFYYPERSLTDEELLQLIDLEHKNLYIYERIQREIVSGQYRPGEKLPSVRDLATVAAVNPNTMQKAFAELERSGLIVTQRTSGRTVTEDTELIKNTREQLAAGHVRNFINNMQELGYQREEIRNLFDKVQA